MLFLFNYNNRHSKSAVLIKLFIDKNATPIFVEQSNITVVLLASHESVVYILIFEKCISLGDSCDTKVSYYIKSNVSINVVVFILIYYYI